jgi:hypothetical protein
LDGRHDSEVLRMAHRVKRSIEEERAVQSILRRQVLTLDERKPGATNKESRPDVLRSFLLPFMSQ